MTEQTTATQLNWVAVDRATGEVITDSKASRTATKHQQLFESLATVCQMLPERDDSGAYRWNLMTKHERGMLNRAAKELEQIEATTQEVLDFETWFYDNDWRGQRGQTPLPTDVTGLFTRSRQSCNGNSRAQKSTGSPMLDAILRAQNDPNYGKQS